MWLLVNFAAQVRFLRFEVIQTFKNCNLSPEHTTSSSSSSSSKRPRLDQIPAANLDADDPLTDVGALTASLGSFFWGAVCLRGCVGLNKKRLKVQSKE